MSNATIIDFGRTLLDIMDVQLNALDKIIAINEQGMEVVGVPRPDFGGALE